MLCILIPQVLEQHLPHLASLAQRFPCLREIKFADSCGVEDDHLAALNVGALTALRGINLNKCRDITDEGKA